MIYQTLARECAKRCRESGTCPVAADYCSPDFPNCQDVREEDWLIAMQKNDRLFKHIDATIGAEIEDENARAFPKRTLVFVCADTNTRLEILGNCTWTNKEYYFTQWQVYIPLADRPLVLAFFERNEGHTITVNGEKYHNGYGSENQKHIIYSHYII